MPTSAAIRHLFLSPQPAYPLPEAAALLGMEVDRLRALVEVGEVEAEGTGDGRVIPWGELVSFGIEVWSREVVEEALGEELEEAIPELMRLSDLQVRIPRMQVVTLERLAAIDGETVSAVLARELRDLVSVHAEWVSAEVPGFAEALQWPDDDARLAGGAAGKGGRRRSSVRTRADASAGTVWVPAASPARAGPAAGTHTETGAQRARSGDSGRESK